MRTIKQSWAWMQVPEIPLRVIEAAGRTCYKSEDKITNTSSKKFVERVLKLGHESVIEHVSASVKFITNRGVTHELVRHRLCAFSQESARYVNYGGDDIEFVLPVWAPVRCEQDVDPIEIWQEAMLCAEAKYKELLSCGWRPEQAREVLPNSLKTEIVVTANMREWRHIFKLRTAKAAHPQMRSLMLSCLDGFKAAIPVLFDEL